MAKTIKMNKYIVMFSLFFIFLIVTCSLGYREGYVDNIITGPGGNKLVINATKFNLISSNGKFPTKVEADNIFLKKHFDLFQPKQNLILHLLL